MNSNVPMPHATEVERMALSSMMASESVFITFYQDISEEMFYHTGHQEIFAFMIHNQCFDSILISERFPGLREIMAEILQTPPQENLSAGIEILLDRSVRRKLLAMSYRMAEQILEHEIEARQIADEAHAVILALNEQKQAAPEHIRPILSRTMNELRNRSTGLRIVKTGLVDIDEKVGGFLPGELIIIAARPGMGKSSLALNVVRHNAIEKKLPVLVFTLEMNKTLTAGRILFGEAGESYDAALRGILPVSGWSRVGQTANAVIDAPIIIDDSPVIGLPQIIAKSIQAKNQYGLECVVIDHLQLVHVVEKGRSRNEEMAALSCGLKSLARQLDIPVIALSQLSRSCESRKPSTPILSDLRDSGAIEQDADRVLFIYRDEIYNKDSKEKGIAQILCAKNRNGRIGIVRVAWDGATMQFRNLAHDDDPMTGFESSNRDGRDD